MKRKLVYCIFGILLTVMLTGCDSLFEQTEETEEIEEECIISYNSEASFFDCGRKKVSKGYQLTESDLPGKNSLVGNSYSNFEFLGWYISDTNESEIINPGYVVNSDITLCDSWNKEKDITITFVSEYGEVPAPITVKKSLNDDYAIIDPVYLEDINNKKYFEGWYLDSTFNTKVLKESDTGKLYISDTTTLYAKWLDGYSINLHFDESNVRKVIFPDFGVKQNIYTNWTCGFSYNDNETLDISYLMPEKEGYSLCFWTNIPNPTFKTGEIDDINSETHDIYAYWGKIITITFDYQIADKAPLQEKTCEHAYITYDYSDNLKTYSVMCFHWGHVIDKLEKNEGKAFYGWYTEKECTHRVGNRPEVTEIMEDTTLFAKWGDEYTLNFKADKPSCVIEPIKVNDGYVVYTDGHDWYYYDPYTTCGQWIINYSENWKITDVYFDENKDIKCPEIGQTDFFEIINTKKSDFSGITTFYVNCEQK